MSSDPNTDIVIMDPNQVGKAFSSNVSFFAVDQMLGGILNINYSTPVVELINGTVADTFSTSTPTSPYTIPYNATTDEPLGVKAALRFFLMTVAGTLTGDWTAYMPATKQKFFAVQNNTTGGHNLIIMVSGQTGVKVPPGQMAFCFLNGIDVQSLPFTTGTPIDIAGFISGIPTSSQILQVVPLVRPIFWPANFAGSIGKAKVAATATTNFPILKNGSSIGTMSFAASATVATFTSTGGLAQSGAIGDELEIDAPASPDATLSGINWNITGTR